MVFSEKQILLKNGRTAVFRSPRSEDAESLLQSIRQCAGETPYLSFSPEEILFTVDQERSFIESFVQSEAKCMILCFVDDVLTGNASIERMPNTKTCHRAAIGIALQKSFWGLGIGTAMFQELIQIAKGWKLEQIELECMDQNNRGKALYEKMGFHTVATVPNAFHLPDGSVADCLIMHYKM